MDNRGGCCIARYATGAYDKSKLDTIMLKFRPIAPKPVTGGEVSDVSGGRAKRKYAKDNKTKRRCNRRTRRRKTTPSPVVTLPLIPETPDPKEEAEKKSNNNVLPVWLSYENRRHAVAAEKVVDPATLGFSGSVLTVECVTDTWQEEEEVLRGTDEERKMKLREDTCPGFISDGDGRVTWTNGAYREMVGEEGGVWVVMKVGVPYTRGFTCRVKVQYGFCIGKERSSVLTVPCDVWRMDSGGFAWRLDVKAALSLSLSL